VIAESVARGGQALGLGPEIAFDPAVWTASAGDQNTALPSAFGPSRNRTPRGLASRYGVSARIVTVALRVSPALPAT